MTRKTNKFKFSLNKWITLNSLKFKNKFNKLPKIAKTLVYSFFYSLIAGIISLIVTYFIDDFRHSYESWLPFVIFGTIFVITFVIDFFQFRKEL